MAITYKGNVTFDDAMEPRAGKSDWGMDTLTRRMKGASTLLAAYLATLVQGDTYAYNSHTYYLQTWEPDDDSVFATVTLSYKGLNAGIPAASAVDETTIQTTSISTDSPEKATRDIEFYSPQTTWRYINSGRPAFASYGSIANGRTASIIRSVITDKDGKRYPGNAPAGLVSALFVSASNRVTGPHCEPIYGTPYFECQDVVQNGFWT